MVNLYKTLTLLLLLGCVSGVDAFKPASGVSNTTMYFEAVRNPFVGGTKLGGVVVSIYRPLDGGIEYTTLIPLNYTISGGTQPYFCRYRVNGGNWTNITACAEVNGSFALGINVLEVEATDDNGVMGNGFSRFLIRGFGGGEMDWWLYIVVALLLVYVFTIGNKNEIHT